MLDVKALLSSPKISSNYYVNEAYLQGDFEAGLLESRAGDRLLALPDTFLQGVYSGIEDELGAAAHQVLFSCGRWWGKNFYRRFAREMAEYHGKLLAELEMINFIQSLKQCWKAHGLGTIELDMQNRDQGFIVVRSSKSSFAQAAGKRDKPSSAAEAGFFSAFFTQLSGEPLHCVQTACESAGAPFNSFIVGTENRLRVAEAGIEEGESHTNIMQRLCPTVDEGEE
ncbi:MAG: V4R domain-containing protein [Cyanobacteria bacterium P01_A01_bin.3]